MLPKYFYWILLLTICGYAFWHGRSHERVAALTCLGASILSLLALSPISSRYSNVEVGLVVVDGVTLAIFTAIALHSNRFWPLWVAGLQLTTSMAHLLKAIELDLLPFAYGAAARFWSYPILIIIAIGTWRCHQRMRAQGRPAAA